MLSSEKTYEIIYSHPLSRAYKNLVSTCILRYQGKQVASKKYKQRGMSKSESQEIDEKGDNALSTRGSRSTW